MKSVKIITTSIVLILFIVTPVPAARVRVMTYNLQGMKPGSDPETRILHIISNLKDINPDIIGLQEINESGSGIDNQAQIIADSLGAYFGEEFHVYMEFTHLSWDNQFEEYIGIITRYRVLEEGFGQLVTGVFPRKVVWNALETPLGRVNVFNTHLSFNSASVRKLQVQQIIGFINQKEQLIPGIASILMGDFNDGPDSEAILLLTDPGTEIFYIDSYVYANPGSPGYTVPAYSPDSRIDYIFERSTSIPAIDTSMVVMNEPYDGVNYCSDHLGVLTVFAGEYTGSAPCPEAPSFSLLPPRPNPMTGTSLIPFVLHEDAVVSLKIYSMTGRLVRSLLAGMQPAGFHGVIWDSRDGRGTPVPSASYVVRLMVRESSRDHYVTLIR